MSSNLTLLYTLNMYSTLFLEPIATIYSPLFIEGGGLQKDFERDL